MNTKKKETQQNSKNKKKTQPDFESCEEEHDKE